MRSKIPQLCPFTGPSCHFGYTTCIPLFSRISPASKYYSLFVFPCFHSFHSFCFSLTHSVSLGADPPSKPHNPSISSVPQVLKKLTSPLPPSLDNSNMLLTFNSNTYNDSRTVSKHILIPSYVIQVI